MSKEALAKVVQRAISDGAFRRQLSTDPGTALRGFDLTADESAAIRSGDSSRLSTLGVDLRMSKAFSLASDQATGDAARPVLSNDLGASYTGATTVAGQGSAGSSASALTGQSSASSANTLTGQSSAGSSAHDLGGQSSMGSSALTSGNQADHEAIISAGTNAGRDQTVIPGEPAHALGDQAGGDEYLSSVNVLTPGDTSKDGILVIDDQGVSGASTPGEASDGPTLSH